MNFSKQMKPSKIINVWCDPLRIRPPPNRQKLTRKSSKWAIFHPWNPSTNSDNSKKIFFIPVEIVLIKICHEFCTYTYAQLISIFFFSRHNLSLLSFCRCFVASCTLARVTFGGLAFQRTERTVYVCLSHMSHCEPAKYTCTPISFETRTHQCITPIYTFLLQSYGSEIHSVLCLFVFVAIFILCLYCI